MFELSVVLQWVGVMVQTIVYTMYAMSGHSPHTTTGELLLGGSEITFLAIMLLMAKGYTITRARLSSRSMIRLATFLNVYIIAFMSLFIFQAVVGLKICKHLLFTFTQSHASSTLIRAKS